MQNEAVGNEAQEVEPGSIEWIARDDNKAVWQEAARKAHIEK